MQEIECPVRIQKHSSVDDVLVAIPHESVDVEDTIVTRAELICNVANCAVQAYLEDKTTSSYFAVKDAQTCAIGESSLEVEYKVSLP